VTTRTAHFDTWARQFLAVHPSAVVLHLGCGLDGRYFRLQPSPQVQWYDVDYPDVAELYTRLYPAADHHHVVAASVTDPAWVAEIPTDRPTLMIAEGLTMYLSEQEGIALMRRVVDHFERGELQFDAFNRLAIKSQWINKVVRRSGSTLRQGIDGPDEILEAVPGTRLLSWVRWFESDNFERLPPGYRVMGRVMSLVPAMANMSQYHRYAFGPA
jgi:O-methyltransferase involved in polyketide biosynthesis